MTQRIIEIPSIEYSEYDFHVLKITRIRRLKIHRNCNNKFPQTFLIVGRSWTIVMAVEAWSIAPSF